MIDSATLRSLVKYRPETGEFVRLVGSGKGAKLGAITLGTLDSSNGYRRLCVGGRRYYAHRLAWLYVTGSWPEKQIDHRNLDRGDNRFSNLRPATNAQNNQREKARADSETKVLGVSWHKRAGKYVSQIGHEGQTRYLGLFETIEEATAVRRTAEVSLHSHHRSAP